MSKRTCLGVALVLITSAAGGCQSPAEKKCNATYKEIESRVRGINPTDKKSVEFALSGIADAKDICRVSKQQELVDDLSEAEQNYQAHLARLDNLAKLPRAPEPQVVSLDEMQKTGDPNCPLGQGYKHPQLDKLIKCSGPSLIQSNWVQAAAHFGRHGYRVVAHGSTLEAKKSAQVYRYTYDEAESETAAKCLQMAWEGEQTAQQAISFATNVPVEDIDLSGPLSVDEKELALSVGESEKLHTASLGACKDLPDVSEPFLPAAPDAKQPSATPPAGVKNKP